jgi:hypothetical protein
MRERRHPNVVAVALANKNARIVWVAIEKFETVRIDGFDPKILIEDQYMWEGYNLAESPF